MHHVAIYRSKRVFWFSTVLFLLGLAATPLVDIGSRPFTGSIFLFICLPGVAVFTFVEGVKLLRDEPVIELSDETLTYRARHRFWNTTITKIIPWSEIDEVTLVRKGLRVSFKSPMRDPFTITHDEPQLGPREILVEIERRLKASTCSRRQETRGSSLPWG